MKRKVVFELPVIFDVKNEKVLLEAIAAFRKHPRKSAGDGHVWETKDPVRIISVIKPPKRKDK